MPATPNRSAAAYSACPERQLWWAGRAFLLLSVVGFQLGPIRAAGDPARHAGTAATATPLTWPASRPAHAVLLFIGDGMGDPQRTAARWQSVGAAGELSMDALPGSGWSRTSSADSLITDSAAAATAIAAGVKTNNGMIAMDPGGAELTTILELAQQRGRAVGLVTTVQLAHATPAAFAAHVPDRNMMTEIALQLTEAGVDVLLGGGEDEFLPTDTSGCYPQAGERTDGRNLVNEFVAAGYTYVCDQGTFDSIDPGSTARLVGLFADEGMVRPFSPSLASMTQTAIDILSRDPEGFFLMVEGGQIDWAGHANDGANIIGDTTDFDGAVAVGRAYAQANPNTLVIVTADHETGGMSVSLSSTGAVGEDGPFWMPDATPFYVNWTTTGHTSADVPSTASGPWSELLTGTQENTRIFEVMRNALSWWIWLPGIWRG